MEGINQDILDSYYSGVRELITNDCIAFTGDAFAYENDRLCQLYEQYFHFGITNLSKNDNQVPIAPARLYFRDRDSMNGRAGKRGEFYVIGINKGVIQKLYEFFKSHSTVFQRQEFEDFITLEKEVTDPLGYLMFQLCTAFTFYHEKAHLLQASGEINTFVEKYQWDEDDAVYSLPHHLHEIDADLYAAHFCVMHILGYWDGLTKSLQTTESLEKLMVCAVAAIFCYWLFLAEGSDEFYYKAYKHPHPVIRASYLVTGMHQTLEVNGTSVVLPKSEKVIREAIDLANKMFLLDGEHRVEAFAETFMKESAEIEAYINELLVESRKYPNLTLNF